MELADRVINQKELLWNKDWEKKPIIFWGCGNNAKIVKRLLEKKGITPTAFCDNNPILVGGEIEGVRILSYEQVVEQFDDYCIVLTVAINNAIPILDQLESVGEKKPVFHMEKPFKVDEDFLEYDYMIGNMDRFEEVYNMLEDEKSKDIFVTCVNFKLSGNKMELMKYVDGDTFFDEKIIPLKADYSFVDVGAYTGDTLLRFYGFCRGKYEQIYALEPDKGNFNALQHLVKFGRLNNIHLFNVGGWDTKTELTFFTLANNDERHFDSPNFFKGMEDTIPNSLNIQKEMYIEEKIEVDTVDNLLQGAKCDVIKINALAADFQVLRGSRETIKKYKPVIVGEYGTQKEYLLDMIKYIKEIEPTYKIYLRQKMIFGDCKTVYIATV